jgi:hypothetical protein
MNPMISEETTAAGFWRLPGFGVELWVAALSGFRDVDGQLVPAGSLQNGRGLLLKKSCTLNADKSVSVPAVDELPHTTDSIDNPTAQYIAALVPVTRSGTLAGSARVPWPDPALASGWGLPTYLSGGITWPQIILANLGAPLINPPATWPTFRQMIDYINTLPPAARATTVIPGVGRLDVPAVNSADPEFVGSNSYASTSHPGIAKISAPPADLPIAWGKNDTNLGYNLANYLTLAVAVSAIGSSKATLIIASDMTVSASLTVPSTTTLRFLNGAKLTVASGQTLAINGPVDAGHFQIFAGSGTVSLSAYANPLSIAWFGVAGDNTTDDRANYQKILNAAPSYSTIIHPDGFNCSISGKLTMNGKTGIKLIGSAAPLASAYNGQGPAITWNGAAKGIMLEMVNSASCYVGGIYFRKVGAVAANGAAYGIFTTADYTLSLTGVTTTATSGIITFNATEMPQSLPNGDDLYKGRAITLTDGVNNYTGTITTTTTNTSGGATTCTVSPVVAFSVAGTGTGTVVSPYPQQVNSSHVFENLNINAAGASNALAYRTCIAVDLYFGQNSERMIVRNCALVGSGGGGSTTSATSGIGLSFGGYYASNNGTSASPLSGYGGGANVLNCEVSNCYFAEMSYAIHGMSGIITNAEGTYTNVAMLGSVSGVIALMRFEQTRQYFHGSGQPDFQTPIIASVGAGPTFPVFEIYGGSTELTLSNLRSDIGGAFGSLGTPTVKCISPTIAHCKVDHGMVLDSTLDVRAGTDYAGFQTMDGYFDGTGRITYGLPHLFLGGWPASSGPLPAAQNGTLIWTEEGISGLCPATYTGGPGAFAIRQNGIWRALGNLSGTATYDPPNLADGATATTSVTVNGAAVGDPVIAGHTSIVAAGWEVSANVISTNTVSVRITNHTGGAVDLGSGTLTATVLQGA